MVAHLREDPPYYAEGLEWIRIDVTPPLRKKYRDGKIYEQPWILHSTEAEAPPPGGDPSGDQTTDIFNILTGTDDQRIYQFGATYPPGSGPNRDSGGGVIVAQRSFTTQYFTDNALLRFDTSTIPDTATITGATLRFYASTFSNVNSLSLTGGWYVWDGASSTDFTGTPETTAIAAYPLSGITVSSDNDVVLSDSAGFPNISKTGYTYLRLHVSQRAANAAPTGANSLQIVAYENPYSSPRCRLLVTYST